MSISLVMYDLLHNYGSRPMWAPIVCILHSSIRHIYMEACAVHIVDITCCMYNRMLTVIKKKLSSGVFVQ